MNTNKNIITQKDLIHIFTLTSPKFIDRKSGFKSSIASTVILKDKEDLFISQNFLHKMFILDLRKILLLIISDDIDKLNIISYKDTFRNNIECSVSIIELNINEFFSLKGFKRFIEIHKNNSYEIVYAVKGKTWHEICGLFITILFDISGGSNSKKHLFAPHQQRLSQFLTCLFSSDASLKVNESFHELSKIDRTKSWNYTPKKVREDILKMITTNENEKSRVFKDFNLSDFVRKDYLQGEAHSEHNLQKIDNSSNIDNTKPKGLSPNCYNTADSSNLSSISKVSKSKFHTSAILFNSDKSVLSDQLPDMKDILVESKAPKINNDLKKTKKTNIEEYLESIKEIILKVESDSNNEDKRREIQEKFENSWINLIEENLKNDSFFINKFQNKLFTAISEATITLDSMNENKYLKKKFPQLGEELNKKEYIILTFSICISLYSKLSYNYIAIKIGEEILYLNYKNKYFKNKKLINNKSGEFTSFYDYKKLLKIDKTYYIKLGDFFLSILQTYPHDLFNRGVTLDSYFSKEPFQLEINKEYLEDIKKNLILNPSTLPMISKPIEWNKDNYGGYLSNNIKHNDIITSSGELTHKVENKDSIYKAVNYLNSIKFSINNNLLNYLLSDEGSYILYNIKPEDDLQRELTLFIAKFYKNIYFYLNTQTDWRGRIYTQSFYLSYQAGDLSSALLNFWEGEPISEVGKAYLYIYGANSHNEKGISKSSYADRIKWVKVNYEKIINLDKDLILSAESPFIFTAFCLNMKEIHNNPNAIIKTPVFLDATCSGIQHLAALIKDLELGGNTNLKPSKNEDRPEDLYSVLLEHINKKINNYGLMNPDFGIFSLIKLTRKEIKTSVMTKVYNVTIYGISQQLQSIFKKVNETKTTQVSTSIEKEDNIKEEFEKEFYQKPIDEIKEDLTNSLKSNKSKTKFICLGHDGKKIELSKKDIYKIATIINDEIFVKYPSLNNIYNYFMDITKITSNLGIPLTWITPSGLKITQKYQKSKQKVITVSIFGKSKKLVLRENDSKLDPIKQSQAIIPNIVHSLDASHLINLINSADDINFKPIITIHDCFGTLPNKMNELDFMVRKEFILIYSKGKFLNDFHNRFLQSITDNQYELDDKNNPTYVILDSRNRLPLPSIPKLGELDVENIKNSKYMIS